MVEGVLAVDTDERVIAVNAAAARLLDTDPATAEGKTIQEVVRNPELQRVVGADPRAGSGRWRPTSSCASAPRTATCRPTARCCTATTDGGGVGAVVVLNDVTRLKRLEAVRRDFVANVSHELKTPVTSIKGFAETLRGRRPRRPGRRRGASCASSPGRPTA